LVFNFILENLNPLRYIRLKNSDKNNPNFIVDDKKMDTNRYRINKFLLSPYTMRMIKLYGSRKPVLLIQENHMMSNLKPLIEKVMSSEMLINDDDINYLESMLDRFNSPARA
jgi:hypothetical protein